MNYKELSKHAGHSLRVLLVSRPNTTNYAVINCETCELDLYKEIDFKPIECRTFRPAPKSETKGGKAK
jgi:hypothetical protein